MSRPLLHSVARAGLAWILLVVMLSSGNLYSATASDFQGMALQAAEGEQGNGDSMTPSISDDGRFVAFLSTASNLVNGDSNGYADVFVHDRQTEMTERVSLSSTGEQSNSDINALAISGNGRFVAFVTGATNLAPGDTNGSRDVFVRDRQTGVTERISVSSNGEQANGASNALSISAEGRFVAFSSSSTNLVSGDTNGAQDIFVRDRQAGTTERVSISSAGAQANNASDFPSLSADGRFVAFVSGSSTLVTGDTNGQQDIFVRDRETGQTERLSVSSAGTQSFSGSFKPSISANGRLVTFYSNSSNLVDGDTNGTIDIFVRDREMGLTERVSVSTAGVQSNGNNNSPSISYDGRYVGFTSTATNLVGGDTNGTDDIFLRDRQTEVTEKVSVSSTGAQGNAWSNRPTISANGDFVAFDSFANNLVAGDTNGHGDVFVRDLQTGTTERVSLASAAPVPVDLDVSASPVRLAPYIYQEKQDQPKTTTLEVDVHNLGADTATNVTALFVDGAQTLASTTVTSIPGGGTATARAEWMAAGNPAHANITVQVQPGSGQIDSNPANNISAAPTPVLVAYAGDASNPFRFDPDTFRFENWPLTWPDFRQQLIDTVTGQQSVYEHILGPFWYGLSASSGHCYGMSQASIVYWDTPSKKPVAMDTYDMSLAQAADDIRDHHLQQLFLVFSVANREHFDRSVRSPQKAYTQAYQRLTSTEHRPSLLSFWAEQGSHSVVAYKVVEVGAEKFIFVYENIDPMPESPHSNILRLPAGQNLLVYQNYPSLVIDKALISDPIRSPGEITAGMMNDVKAYILRQIAGAGKSVVFFSWGSAGGGTGLHSMAAQDNFLLKDELGRRVGYSDGVVVNEIPGAELSDYETGLYVTLPAGATYTLTTIGAGAANNTLSLAVPTGANQVQETIYEDFAIPQGVTATTTFSKDTEDWRIEIPGQPDVLPDVYQVETVGGPIFLPVITR